MSGPVPWSFTDHNGNRFEVMATNEREACQKANAEADARDGAGIDGLLDDPDVQGLMVLLSERPRYGGIQHKTIKGPSTDLKMSGVGKPWESRGETQPGLAYVSTAAQSGDRYTGASLMVLGVLVVVFVISCGVFTMIIDAFMRGDL